ncbi:MATE family efflux transporter [Roseburia hominis]
MNETFMKEKPILPLITSMALPMVISMLVNSLYNIVDSFFVAKISEDAMTALSLVFPVQNFVSAVAIGFGIGINAVIAFYLGADDEEKANITAVHGLVLSLTHGIVMMIGSIAVMPAFLGRFTSAEQVVDLGMKYSRIVFAFSPVLALCLYFEKVFQAVGKMKVGMVSMLAGCITNIILDPIMIFGLGPFPAMGISGAALATGIGQVVSTAVHLVVYTARPIRVRIRKKYFVRNGGIDRKLYAIGVPAILNLALPSVLISAFNAILSEYSQIYVVILGIYYKLQTFLYLPASGIIQGMRPVIGYNYGAGEKKRVKQIYYMTIGLCGAIMAVGTVICLAIPGQLIGLFTENQETILAGQTALRIISAGFIISAVSVTASGALEGLGKGAPSLAISLSRYIVVIIPVAFALSRIWGPVGAWNAFWITEVVTAGVAFAVMRLQIK